MIGAGTDTIAGADTIAIRPRGPAEAPQPSDGVERW
jgi:hypothetical protein